MQSSRLLDIRPVLLHGFLYTPPLEDVSSNILIRIHLRLDQVEGFFRHRLRYAHDAVHVADDDVARVDDGLLLLAVQAHGSICLTWSALDDLEEWGVLFSPR